MPQLSQNMKNSLEKLVLQITGGTIMKYESINEYTDKEIMNILYYGSVSDMKMLSLSVGEYHQSYDFAQDVCFFLLDSPDEDVRANAVLGLSYIARRFSKLDVEKLKLFLSRQQPFSKENTDRVEYSLEDISLFLNESVDWCEL